MFTSSKMNNPISSLKIKGTQPAGWFVNLDQEVRAKPRKSSNAQPGTQSSLVIIGTKPAGWFVNMDQEVGANSQQNSDDPPGPSGVQSTPASEIDEAVETKNDQPCANGTSIEEANQEETEKAPHPMAIFAERVTIAGLEEAYKAEYKHVRLLFRASLVLAFGLIVYLSYLIADHYWNESNILITVSEIDTQAPFPNISVCFQPFTADRQLWRFMIIPEKAKKLMTLYNMTDLDAMNFARRMILLDLKIEDAGTAVYLILRIIYDATIEHLQRNGLDLWSIIRPTCSQIMSNCSYGGREFDCCQASLFTTMVTHHCFQIDIGQISDQINNGSTEIEPEQRDPMQLEKIGLEFHVNTDWTYGLFDDAGVASDGYYIFIGLMAHHYNVPVQVPANMDALITLSQPKILNQIEQCLDPRSVPKLRRFNYYDPNGDQCKMDMTVDIASENLGCSIPVLSSFPTDLCNVPQQLLVALFFSDGAMNQLPDDPLQVEKRKRDLFEKMQYLISDKSPCLPLCSRWTYPVFSASYSSITYGGSDEDAREFGNRSWSRIRVISPYSSSWSQSEDRRDMSYLLMCDIGGVMGVYAGFSMITFAQIVAYGFYVLWTMRKRKRAVRPEEVMSG